MGIDFGKYQIGLKVCEIPDFQNPKRKPVFIPFHSSEHFFFFFLKQISGFRAFSIES